MNAVAKSNVSCAKGQCDGAGDVIGDAERLALFLGQRVPHERLGHVQRRHPRARLRQPTGVRALPAADVQPAPPLHRWQHLQERGRVEVIAVDVVPPAHQPRPHLRVVVPAAPDG
jgi:hypothetical protein